MRWRYDGDVDVMSIDLADGPETQVDYGDELSADTVVEYDADDNIIGLELMAFRLKWSDSALVTAAVLSDYQLEFIRQLKLTLGSPAIPTYYLRNSPMKRSAVLDLADM